MLGAAHSNVRFVWTINEACFQAAGTRTLVRTSTTATIVYSHVYHKPPTVNLLILLVFYPGSGT